VSFDSRKAADYIRGRFKDAFGLCCESIYGDNDMFEKTFWLMNDNVSAIVALDRLNEPSLRDKIKGKLQTFTTSCIETFGHDAFRNRGWVDPFIHQDVFDLRRLRTPWCYCWDDLTKKFGPPLFCREGMIGVMQEEWNGSEYEDEERYPNLAASKALSWHKQYVKTQSASDRQNRDFFITRMENLWNPANLGFGVLDRERRMDTYYLAAYLLVGEKTGWPEPFDPGRRTTVKKLLNSLQLAHGGFAAKYIVQDGEVVWREWNGNVETTSLAVYANILPKDYTAF